MRPSDFTIGSVESRAAAWEELRRRISHDFSEATVVISTGLPTPRFTDGPPVATPPDFIGSRIASDGSIVEGIHRYWQGKRKAHNHLHRSDMARRESIQRREESYVESLSDFKKLFSQRPNRSGICGAKMLTPKPWEFQLNSPESRSAARMLAEHRLGQLKRIEIVTNVRLPFDDNSKLHATAQRNHRRRPDANSLCARGNNCKRPGVNWMSLFSHFNGLVLPAVSSGYDVSRS